MVEDIAHAQEEGNEKNYYLGILVVHEKTENGKTVYETIDGQQRLTALFILLCVLKNEFGQEIDQEFKRDTLDFESRDISDRTLDVVFESKEGEWPEKELNVDITGAYKIIEKELKKPGTDINAFTEYLLDHVIMIRVPVPDDTDLNRYFEIMNSRGEQLEKHEILKAWMVKELKNGENGEKDKKEKRAFNRIWEACSDMNRYVQFGFTSEERNNIFGDNWNKFKPGKFDDIKKLLVEKNKDSDDGDKELPPKKELTIEDIIKPSGKDFGGDTEGKSGQEKPDRFISPIDFPNFLLHVLKVIEPESNKNEKIPLDDKKLLDIFSQYLKNDGDEAKAKAKAKAFVKKFACELLRLRFLFDQYILKREYTNNKDGWSLKKPKKGEKSSYYYVNTFGQEEDDNGINKKLLMLLSMFHVSFPARTYKYWLFATLRFLREKLKESKNTEEGENIVDPKQYREFLEFLADAFLCCRFLAKTPDEYESIIKEMKKNGWKRQDCPEIDEGRLNQGTDVENFIFNYLDYLLWKDWDNLEGLDEKIKNNFEFTFRSSVEHFYPRNPIDGNKLEDDNDIVNNFGNLCLVTRSRNSQVSNHMPGTKKDLYREIQERDKKSISLKLEIMLSRLEKEKDWGKKQIIEHRKNMRKKLTCRCNKVASEHNCIDP